GVTDVAIRAPIGIGIQPWNLEETAERSADRVLCELRLRDWHVPPQLERRAVEDRSADGVRRTSLIRPLTARAAAADHRRSTAARPEKTRVLRTEAGCELTGRRIELVEIDHLQSIVHQLAIEVRRRVVACNGDGVALHAFHGKTRRQVPG